MKLTAVLEQRFDRTPDGLVWTPNAHDYTFWKRYLAVFDSVQVVARLNDVPSVTSAMVPVSGERVSFAAVPHFIGLGQYLRVQGQVRRAIGKAVRDPAAGAILLRTPGLVCNVAFASLGRRPFSAEVVGDSYDLYAPGVSGHPLRAMIRRTATQQLKAQCRRAGVVAYVTRQALQQRYPTQGQAFGLSDVNLPPEAYVGHGRRWHSGAYKAIMVCSLQGNYKGVALALQALALLRERGLVLQLRIVGEGDLQPEFEALTARLDLSDQVEFTGSVSGGAGVRAQLDWGDLFLMPSLQEGLPRAMVEAMARGLPAVGSVIGGIPELIEPPELFSAGDVPAIAEAIERLLSNEVRYNAVAQRNLDVARTYGNAELSALRLKFYRAIYDYAASFPVGRRQ